MAQGMIHSAITGTATRLAARPKATKRLKWNMAKGVVASPATNVVSPIPMK